MQHEFAVQDDGTLCRATMNIKDLKYIVHHKANTSFNMPHDSSQYNKTTATAQYKDCKTGTKRWRRGHQSHWQRVTKAGTSRRAVHRHRRGRQNWLRDYEQHHKNGWGMVSGTRRRDGWACRARNKLLKVWLSAIRTWKGLKMRRTFTGTGYYKYIIYPIHLTRAKAQVNSNVHINEWNDQNSHQKPY